MLVSSNYHTAKPSDTRARGSDRPSPIAFRAQLCFSTLSRCTRLFWSLHGCVNTHKHALFQP